MKELTKRQDEIIETAIKIIGKEGIQKLTTRSIAGELNISEAAIYKHFKSKTDILLTLLSRFEQRTEKMVKKVMNNGSIGIQSVKKILLNRIETLIEHPFFSRVILSEEIFYNNKILYEKVNGLIDKHKELFLRVLKESKKKKEIIETIPLEELVTIIMGSFRFLVTDWRISNFEFDLMKAFKKLYRFFEDFLFNMDNRGGKYEKK